MKPVGQVPNRSLRRSQAVSPNGVGAIFDIGGESFVACDTTTWQKKSGGLPDSYEHIELVRLQQVVGAPEGFYMPPTAERPAWGGGGRPTFGLPFQRFPSWLFCQESACRVMTRITWQKEKQLEGKLPGCPHCDGNKPLVPMRFVVACPGGHLADVPWDRWAHQQRDVARDGRCESPVLAFVTRESDGRLSGLGSLFIVCKTCGAEASLTGITEPDGLARIGVRCDGRQPWQYDRAETPCEKKPRVLERGASNVYFPQVASALDIPTDIPAMPLEDEIRSHPNFKFLSPKMLENEVQLAGAQIFARSIASDIGCTVEQVLELLRRGAQGTVATGDDEGTSGRRISEEQLRRDEYSALQNPPAEPYKNYLAERQPIDPEHVAYYGMEQLFEQVTLVHRLREVRALTGFTRVLPGGDEAQRVAPDLGRGLRWLPGYEVFGEGLFVQFRAAALEVWEATHERALEKRLQPICRDWGEFRLGSLPKPTPRFILLHSLAHLLIRELAYQCGYPSASLREQIYCAPPTEDMPGMCGVLVYTADSDAEGSLGGLVRQGRLDFLQHTVRNLLGRAQWCSTDPICLESGGRAGLTLSRAACHSCCLLPETSCGYHNTLLDRYLLVGSPQDQSPVGYFEPMLAKLFDPEAAYATAQL